MEIVSGICDVAFDVDDFQAITNKFQATRELHIEQFN